MKLTAKDIAILAVELDRHCRGALLQRIWDGRTGELVLRLRMPGQTSDLLLAAGDEYARLHLASTRPPRPESPTTFVRLLRKHLLGTRLDRVSPREGDRLVHLDFTRRVGETPARRSFHLVAELSGRHGNLFLLGAPDDSDSPNQSEQVLGSLRPNVSRQRDLRPGARYRYPTLPKSPLQAATTLSDAVQSETPHASLKVEAAFEEMLERSALQRERTGTLRLLRRADKRIRRRIENIAKDQARASTAAEQQRYGELLQSAYGQIPRGSPSADVIDYYDSAMPTVRVPLDRALSLAENIARYFKQSKRLKAAAGQIAARLTEAEQARSTLEGAEARLRTAPDLASIRAIAADLRRDRLIPRAQTTPVRNRRQPPSRLPYHAFTSASGRQILVGRGAEDNDQLTFRVARGRDLWLHADGAAGSHVIIRLDRGTVADSESLLDGATLAAFYSKSKNDGVVDVRYAPRSSVRKPKGAAPGRVTVAGAKTLAVRIEPDRLARIFRTRDELP